jgi:lactate dehydrogenase-like 2-hydroxyacid dehydrogenase
VGSFTLITDIEGGHRQCDKYKFGADSVQEFQSGSREEFLSTLRAGEYDDVVAIYRSNESTSVTGPFNKELVQNLPSSLKYITHNGAGYDNIDVASCTDKGIEVSSTPIAVNEATADGEFTTSLGYGPRSVTI